MILIKFIIKTKLQRINIIKRIGHIIPRGIAFFSNKLAFCSERKGKSSSVQGASIAIVPALISP